jgi:hypothetical protein
MRTEIAFNAEGVELGGWLYLPERADGPAPVVVMAHGFSAVKEMYLDAFAEVFAAAGLAALVFDHRNFGTSGGEPRQEVDPWQQIRDYRHAITYAGTMLPVVAENPLGPCALPTADSWQWYTGTARTRAPAWRNEVTLRSVEMFTEYEPGRYIEWISPTPLMLIVAANDHLTVADEALAAYNRALEPKELVLAPGGHFDAYGAGFGLASAMARDWFAQHLMVASR